MAAGEPVSAKSGTVNALIAAMEDVIQSFVEPFKQWAEQTQLLHGFDVTSTISAVFFFIVFLVASAVLLSPPSKPKKDEKQRNQTSTSAAVATSGVPTTTVGTSSSVQATTKPTVLEQSKKTTSAASAAPAIPTTPSPQTVSAPSSPQPASPPSGSRETSSAQVLRSGKLVKRQIMSKSNKWFELYQEDDRTIGIFYSSSSGTSPSSSKKSSSLYLAGESYIVTHPNSKTGFTVHQLKSGGKKLSLEASTPEQRDEWVKAIEAAISTLKSQNK